MTWDYLVVGSGITGLAFGAMMAKHQGKRVCVVEKHKVAGGYATEFYRKRGEHRFECSLHKVSGISDIGNLKRILANLGFEFELEYVYPPSFFKGYFNNRVMALSNQVDTQITQLCREFPEEKESIEKYFALVASYGKWGYYQFQIMQGEMDADFKLIRHGKKTFAKLTLADYLKENFSNEYLKNILAAPAIYVGANPEQISFLYYLHVVFATLNAGNAFIKGGGQALSNFMVDIIKENGGEVHLANPVHELSFKGDRFITAHARLGNYRANHLIMNASPHYAVRELFPKTEMMIEVDKKLLALKPANSTTTLYLSLKRQPESLGFDDTESMLFATGMSQEIAFRNLARDSNRSSDFEMAYWAQGTMEVTNYHALDSNNGYIVVANVLDVQCHWPDRQDIKYREKKERAKKTLTKRLQKYFHLSDEDILWSEVSTPHTYQRYTNNPAGSGYGALVSPGSSGHTFHYKFPYKNVSFLSSWTAGSGYEAAFSFAEFFTENIS